MVDLHQLTPHKDRSASILIFISVIMLVAIIGVTFFFIWNKIKSGSGLFQPIITSTTLITPSDKLNQTGVSLLKENNYKDAEPYFNQSIQADPNNYKPHYNLGVVYASEGYFGPAITEYKKVLQINANYEPAIINLIGAETTVGDCQTSSETVQKFIKQYPDSKNIVTAHWEAADAYACLKQYESSINELKIIPVIAPNGPDNFRVYYDIGSYYNILGNYKMALSYYLMAEEEISKQPSLIVADKDLGKLYADLGASYFRNSDRKNSIEFFQKALKDNPDYTKNTYSSTLSSIGL